MAGEAGRRASGRPGPSLRHTRLGDAESLSRRSYIMREKLCIYVTGKIYRIGQEYYRIDVNKQINLRVKRIMESYRDSVAVGVSVGVVVSVAEGVSVEDGVSVADGVGVGVGLRVGVSEGVPEGVSVEDGVSEGVTVGLLVIEGVTVGVTVTEGVTVELTEG